MMVSVKQFFSHRVKEQGDRPTCVAFAVSAFHEYWCEVVSSGKSAIGVDLSEEFLFYGCKQRDGLPVGSDGTTVLAASSWLRSDGQCIEALHPYRKTGGLLVVPSAAAVADGKKRTLNSLKSRGSNLDAVVEALGRGVPLVAVVEIFRSAYLPGTGGMLAMPGPGDRKLGLHAVLLVEVDGDEDDRTTIFLNSWGVGWGDRGFGRFSEDYFDNHCKQLWVHVSHGQ